MSDLVPRHAQSIVSEALEDTRVVLVNGARQAGKSIRVIAVEVKAGATVRTEDLAGLRNLASPLGDKFVAGYVLYTGQQTLSYGGRIKALPMDALWLLAP